MTADAEDFAAFAPWHTGEPVDLATASLDTRSALLLEAAHDCCPLVTGGHLSNEAALAYLLRYAEQLRLHGEAALADAQGFDAEAIVAVCLAVAGKGASVPLPSVCDQASWEELHQALLRATGNASPSPIREIRPGVRASESFVSVTMAQATLTWLARSAPGVSPWMALVLVLGELDERRAGVHAELETARRTIQQLRARIAELHDE